MNKPKRKRKPRMKYYTVIGYDYGEKENWLVRVVATTPNDAAEKALKMANEVTDQAEVVYVLNGWSKSHKENSQASQPSPIDKTPWEKFHSTETVHPNFRVNGYAGSKTS